MPRNMMTDLEFVKLHESMFGFGYGSGEPHTIGMLHDLTDYIRAKNGRSYSSEELEVELGPTAAWLVINLMCRFDLFEYGTSPRNGWLTEKGEELSEYLKDKDIDELYAMVMRFDGEDLKPVPPSARPCVFSPCDGEAVIEAFGTAFEHWRCDKCKRNQAGI